MIRRGSRCKSFVAIYSRIHRGISRGRCPKQNHRGYISHGVPRARLSAQAGIKLVPDRGVQAEATSYGRRSPAVVRVSAQGPRT